MASLNNRPLLFSRYTVIQRPFQLHEGYHQIDPTGIDNTFYSGLIITNKLEPCIRLSFSVSPSLVLYNFRLV